jgi:hypothetical protein
VQINPHSEEILASSAALGDVARMPFLDRQRALAEKARERRLASSVEGKRLLAHCL